MNLSIDKAAQCWCDPRVSDREMDHALCEVVAEGFEDILSKPWLGNATTEDLLRELMARAEVDERKDLSLFFRIFHNMYSMQELRYRTSNNENP